MVTYTRFRSLCSSSGEKYQAGDDYSFTPWDTVHPSGSPNVPVDPNGHIWLRYRKGPGAFEHFSASDILTNRIPQGAFAGKVVFVGSTASGRTNIAATPFDRFYPGVAIQATVLDNILMGDCIVRPGWMNIFELITLISLGFSLLLS